MLSVDYEAASQQVQGYDSKHPSQTVDLEYFLINRTNKPIQFNMKAQAILAFLMVVVLAAVLVAASSDDEKCRLFAKRLGVTDEELVQVEKFRLYGMPKAPEDCGKLCNKHDLSVAFEYVGKQACCCGKPVGFNM